MFFISEKMRNVAASTLLPMENSSVSPSSSAIADDEIDLGELVAALGRRWRWLLGGLLLGLGLGGVAAWRSAPPLTTLRLVVNLDKGPQVQSAASMDRTDSLGPLLITTFKPLNNSASTRLQLEQLVPLALRQQGWEVAPLKLGKDVIPSALALSAAVPALRQAEATAALEGIARRYRQQQEQQMRQMRLAMPPQASWITLTQEEAPKPRGPGRSLALGGLAGLVVGAGAALVADRRSQRVYGLNRLQQLLPYPVWGSLPPAYPQGPWSGQAEAQLAVFLRPQLAWRVLSIAEGHPLLAPLAQELQRLCPQLDLQAGPVLLREPFNPAAGEPVGCLLLVEPGFNSEPALRQVQQLLLQLPEVEQVGLVLAGQPLAPELR